MPRQLTAYFINPIALSRAITMRVTEFPLIFSVLRSRNSPVARNPMRLPVTVMANAESGTYLLDRVKVETTIIRISVYDHNDVELLRTYLLFGEAKCASSWPEASTWLIRSPVWADILA